MHPSDVLDLREAMNDIDWSSPDLKKDVIKCFPLDR
jgi:hypothetical protein